MPQTNSEAANKPHTTQNRRPTQMQTLSQHRHMHLPIDKCTETTSASQAVKQTPQNTTLPTTVPEGKMLALQAIGCHRKATACTAKRLHSPRDAGPPTSRPAMH
ncbi:hypothetical protein CHARACLAT_030437 [Characodon lateralis]|uniref:Uncharacterized protein n=1 Tax=Characodon lateralis TaxID=208331 RepID=A0ABU7DBA5_9TELE|nr:hypothetical protein [Characodon lateralis]